LARRLKKREQKLDLVIIDYLGLVDADGRHANRTAEVSYISRQFKRLAMELGIPVLLLSQLNRGVEQRVDKRPLLSDLRESGAIEQDANAVIFLYRDDYYNPASPDKGTCEVIVAKNRNGWVGSIKLGWEPSRTKFTNRRAA
jgi:replicative DNA helicase